LAQHSRAAEDAAQTKRGAHAVYRRGYDHGKQSLLLLLLLLGVESSDYRNGEVENAVC
jgi:hypothetical protein